MNKSRNTFLILSAAYIGIAVGGMLKILIINENVLLGLSLASLLISLGDTLSESVNYYTLKNSYNYALKFTSEYLKGMVDHSIINVREMDVCNVMLNIDNLITMRNAIHPNELNKKNILFVLRYVTVIMYTLGISCFVVVPFISHTVDNKTVSEYVTMFAFATMCGNIYLSEIQRDVAEANSHFFTDKVCIVELMFPGFSMIFNNELQHKASAKQMQKIYDNTISSCCASEQNNNQSNT